MDAPIFGRASSIEHVSEYFDKPEDFEPQHQGKSDDFNARYFERINRIPPLSKAEADYLLERWCSFRDEKAKERIASAHLRMVPPIARNTARRFGFEPFWDALPAPVKRDAVTGYQEIISELTAEGNLALLTALEGYRLDQGVVFYTYALTCVRNAIMRRAKGLRSNVYRPFERSGPWDLSIDPRKPDPLDFRDYVGSRASPTTRDDPEDDDGCPAGRMYRLRPPPTEPHVEFAQSPRRYSRAVNGAWRAGLMSMEPTRDCKSILAEGEARLLWSRMRGLTLKEIAGDLGVSVSTVWRAEKAAIQKLGVNAACAQSYSQSKCEMERAVAWREWAFLMT